jgi:hypothetical protein
MSLPTPVRASFEEGLAIHRAVSGADVSLASFIEALVAEAHASPSPPDVTVAPLHDSERIAEMEEQLARDADYWLHLDPVCAETVQTREIRSILRRIDSLSVRAGIGDWFDIDRQLRSLIALESELERGLENVLSQMAERGAWREMMFSGAGHYGEQRLGLSRTSTEDHLGLRRALRRFPLLRAAYDQGRIKLHG